MYLNKMKKLNTVVMDKTTGELFEISEIGSDSIKLAKVTREEDESGKTVFNRVEPEETITVTKDNSICFRFYADPNPDFVPTGYILRNGIIYQESSDTPATEQGELKFEKILGSVEGGVILVGYTERNPEDKALYCYTPAGDRFINLVDYSDKTTLVKATEKYLVLVVSDVVDVTIPAEDEKSQPTVVHQVNKSAVMFVYAKEVRSFSLKAPLDAFSMKIADDKYMIFNSYDASYEDDEDVYEDDYSDYDDYEDDSYGQVLTEFKYDSKLVINLNLMQKFRVHTVEEAAPVVSPVFGLTFISDNTFEFRNGSVETSALAGLGDCNILVDYNGKEDEKRYVFASKDHKVKTLCSEETLDRGVIYRIK